MKKIIAAFTAVLLLPVLISAQQVQKKDPVGIWKFEVPDAPEGYRSGSLSIALAGKKYSASMFFPEYSIKIPAEKISVVKDSVFFTMYTEGREVNISLKITGPLKMQGKAVHFEGEIPLSLTKESKPQ
jgi:hypothetical protein